MFLFEFPPVYTRLVSIFVYSCLTLAATYVISSARCPHSTSTSQGLQINRQDLMTVFDEVDYIISQQVNSAIEQG